MRRWNRALCTLVGAAAAGFLLWYVPHFDRWSTSGYWAVMGLMLIAGVVIGVSQAAFRDGNPRASFLLAFLPVFVAAGWVILAAQPEANWVQDHVVEWSGDLGIDHAVRNLAEHVSVLAFGLGVIFGLTFEPAMLRRRSVAPVVAPVAATTTVLPPSEPAAPAPAPVEEETVVQPAAVDEPEPEPAQPQT